MARLYVLGAGTPTPTEHRFGSSYVLEVGGEQLMFDCGPAATHKLVKAGLWPTRINHLFFTHHHFDHDVDYPCFLLCRWDQSIGKEERLRVYGPQPTERFTAAVLDTFAHDWQARVNHPTSQRVFVNRGGTLPRPPPSVDAKDITAGDGLSGRHWQIRTAHAEHVQPWLDSVAYRVDAPEGSIVFTGDTQPCATVVDLARGADTMLCMCWDDQDVMDQNGEAHGQSGTKAAARMAQEAGVKRLVLIHMGRHLATPEVLAKGLADARGIYDGEVVAGEELMKIDL